MFVGEPGKENGLDDFQHLDDYALLGVSSSASPDEIKQAYRREIAKYHPDRLRSADPQTQQYARARSQRLTEAYSTLSRGTRSRPAAAWPAGTQRSARSSTQDGPSGAERASSLYAQATTMLSAGRAADAARLLGQIQRIDPFYRDVDELLARAEAMAQADTQGRASRRPVLWLAGGALAALLLLGGAWRSGVFSAAPATQSAGSPAAIVAEASVAPTATPTASAPPSLAPSAADAPVPSVPAVAASAEQAPAPTPEAVPTATPEPTAPPPPPTEAVPTPTSPPPPPTAVAAASVPAPSRRPAALESGRVLVSDSFDDPGSGWPQLKAATYTLGYRNGAYAITTNPGTGSIFSFGSPLAQGDVVIGADVTPVRGSAGLIFGTDNSYRFFVSADGRFRVDQRGQALVPSTANRAIRQGTNRLTVAAAGRRVSLYANGVLLTNLDLPASLEGTTYGFVVLAGTRGGEGVFDALTVRGLPR